MKKKVSILGAGIIGLCSGYHLLKKGHEVTFLIKTNQVAEPLSEMQDLFLIMEQ